MILLPVFLPVKRALVSQQSTLIIAKDSDISEYLKSSIYSSTNILAIKTYNTQTKLLSLINELKCDI